MPILPLADFEVVSIFFWSVVTIVVIAGAFVGVMALRKWMSDDQPSGAGTGFSLGELRQLVREGKMSPEEFEKAKAILVGTTRKTVEGENSTVRPPIEPKGQ